MHLPPKRHGPRLQLGTVSPWSVGLFAGTLFGLVANFAVIPLHWDKPAGLHPEIVPLDIACSLLGLIVGIVIGHRRRARAGAGLRDV